MTIPRRSLLSTLLFFALGVAANPVVVNHSPIKLTLFKQHNFTSAHNLVTHDQARAEQLKNRAYKGNVAVPVNTQITNQAVTYTASVGVGNPPTTYSLLIDTGSSNTWVGATQGKPYRFSTSTRPTTNFVEVSYGSGSFQGFEVDDKLKISPNVAIQSQSIGAAIASQGFNGVDGILGIGPVGLTAGTLFPATTSTVPTVTDNLFNQGLIPANQVGIYFAPTTQQSVQNGELTYGGTDSSKYTGTISYTPVTTTSPASRYWGINQSIRYGPSTAILSTTAGIVDTGTTLILIASDAFSRYTSATGAVLDNTTGLLSITPAQYAKLQSLYFTTNGVTYTFTANAQLFPRSLNTLIGGTASNIYLIVANLGSPSGRGLDFINGYAFLERFYSVFDTANKRVGFATTAFTTATTN
ncbi:hypothetical protein K443DRAFT_677972 [Laccaria amethystina LaAM-08-1]|uniref:Peptidase A1 domain-containing protein n=1 Tax=Laccaria amethystina LaAM-08-1 TaxID=1095629 RepID=A0A0C9Y1P5_9AGAR|nr:hypothetical protein K443DRAFT_677972 [Laccaria amethystina LaAM-08-1]